MDRYESYGWHTQEISDGTDTKAILDALENAKAETGKPSMIKVKTVIGHGSKKEVSIIHPFKKSILYWRVFNHSTDSIV